MNKIKAHKVIILAVMLIFILTGCATKNDLTKIFYKSNEIISYEPLDTTKTVITICNGMNANTEPLEKALKKRFSNIEVVSSIGTGYTYLEQQAQNNELADIIFYTSKPEFSEYFYDLSAQSFTQRYNLTSLEAISVNNKIYQLPVASSGIGIFYNKTLFEQKGWSIPQSLTEFYELCETIKAANIRPFAPCFKYAATVADVGLGLSSSEIFSDISNANNFYDFTSGNRSSEGVLEPFLEALRGLYTKGLITEDDFSSSATQNRKALYAGEIAMIPYSLNFVSLYDAEKPDCEIGFMGFPTDIPGEHYIALSHDETCMSLSKASMQDKTKSKILLEIFDYLSTNEGQDVLFQCYTGISSVKSYQSTLTARFEEIIDCLDYGRMYFPQQIWTNDDIEVIKKWITTDMSMADMLKTLDQIVKDDLETVTSATVIGRATETFSIMETCAFMADAFKETTNADIGLVLYNTAYKGLIMKIYGGDIILPDVFYIRGVSNKNCLTVYEITGKALKELLEHPYVEGNEVNATYVPSGLKMTYAPWNDKDNNIISVTLDDGAPIEDDVLYKVAAWDTTIDERYLTNVVLRYEELNSSVSYMTEIIKKKGTISPSKDGRITLKW